MKKNLVFTFCFFVLSFITFAGGAPSTYFNIFVPPTNGATGKNVALVVTAIFDSTTFNVIDDATDGDNDDTISGILMAGQSYVLYIKDNGINDDAINASAGIQKNDGDYFIIHSNYLVYASAISENDFQHSFLPAINQKSVGKQFFLYTPKAGTSKADINIFAVEDNTTVIISKISKSATTQTGYTDVDSKKKTIVLQKVINIGQDIIYYTQEGRNLLNPGETYLIETNKNVSIQYGALYENERGSGAQVPSVNGTDAGELFYFAVPYKTNGEQEIRITSLSDKNEVKLDYLKSGKWQSIKSFNLNKNENTEWIGKNEKNEYHASIFRLTGRSGMNFTVLEANAMQTGSPDVSDLTTMVSAIDGNVSGQNFVTYVLPPANETNVVNPLTGSKFGGNISHLYLYASNNPATVTVKDLNTNGTLITKTFNIPANSYADCFFNQTDYNKMITGAPKGSTYKSYVTISSTANIAVMSSNFTDNIATYFGSSTPQPLSITTSSSLTIAAPGQKVTETSIINTLNNQTIENATIKTIVGSGEIVVSSVLTNTTTQTSTTGIINIGANNTEITYPGISTIIPSDSYTITTIVDMSASNIDGSLLPSNNTIVGSQTIVSGTINGTPFQSVSADGVMNETSNSSFLLFSKVSAGTLTSNPTDSWNGAWVDYDNDGNEDLYITEKSGDSHNFLYKNNGNGTFTEVTTGPLVNIKAHSSSCTWADINNDGLIDVFVTNTLGKSLLFINKGSGNFEEVTNSGIDDQPEYFHGASWFDYDNDGFVDLIITNYFETRYHQLYHNNGNNTFTKIDNTPITLEGKRSMAPACADYDNDGLVDVFIPNGNNEANSLFKNMGNGKFTKITSGDIVTDLANSVGAAWGDYNNDGFMDLFVANASNQDNSLYKNNGNGTFTKITNSPVVSDGGQSHCASWADVDNDGDLDLYVTNDIGTKFLYINDGAGNFTRKFDEIICADYNYSFGHIWADYNKDGALDLMVFTHSNQPNWLFKGNIGSNKWINIKLQGTRSNNSAIGAVIRVKANGKWQVRQVNAQSGFGSENSLRQHFGVGAAIKIDSIEVKWPSGYRQYLTNQSPEKFITIIENNASLINGYAFNDSNNNGTKDANEGVIANAKFVISPSNLTVSTNSVGYYEVRLPKGTYTLNFSNSDEYWKHVVTTSVIVGTNPATTYTTNLPLCAKQTGYDITPVYSTTAWRRGFKNQSSIQIENKGNASAIHVVATVKYPSEIKLLTNTTTHLNGNKRLNGADTSYTFVIDTIKSGQRINILLTDSVTLNASVGQQLNVIVDVTANGTDLNQGNNSNKYSVDVVGPIDPNDILVSPKGEGEEGFINKGQLLTYKIRFQNVGTYKTSRVIIKNKIPPYLDINSFKVTASSHNYEYIIDNSGELTITYENIELPDSNTNEAESHGYFEYSILTLNSLIGAESIYNSATIAFDYEDAVQTNRVLNTIKFKHEGVVFNLNVYPNPSQGYVELSIDKGYFKYDLFPIVKLINIFDAYGNLIISRTGNGLSKDDINLSQWGKGMYYIRLIDSENNLHVGEVIVQ